MGIKVHINSLMAQYANNQSIAEVRGDTVGQCLADLVQQFPGLRKALFNEDNELLDYIEIYVNEERIYPAWFATPLKPGDELYLLFMFDGG